MKYTAILLSIALAAAANNAEAKPLVNITHMLELYTSVTGEYDLDAATQIAVMADNGMKGFRNQIDEVGGVEIFINNTLEVVDIYFGEVLAAAADISTENLTATLDAIIPPAVDLTAEDYVKVVHTDLINKFGPLFSNVALNYKGALEQISKMVEQAIIFDKYEFPNGFIEIQPVPPKPKRRLREQRERLLVADVAALEYASWTDVKVQICKVQPYLEQTTITLNDIFQDKMLHVIDFYLDQDANHSTNFWRKQLLPITKLMNTYKGVFENKAMINMMTQGAGLVEALVDDYCSESSTVSLSQEQVALIKNLKGMDIHDIIDGVFGLIDMYASEIQTNFAALPQNKFGADMAASAFSQIFDWKYMYDNVPILGAALWSFIQQTQVLLPFVANLRTELKGLHADIDVLVDHLEVLLSFVLGA